MRHNSAEEFPLLGALGLYAAEIRGDGNCLFNALSDQIHGDQSSHSLIRARVIQYMRDHADYFKQFIDVHPGGGTRRNPKRKNAGAYSTRINAPPPSEEDVDRVFENHLTNMSRGGVWGDNMEITAFSSAYEVDVKIYQRDFAYMVTGMDGKDGPRPVVHIAYHMWEHYSSIRNLDGPHTGLPSVEPRVLSMEEEAAQQEKLRQAPLAASWSIDAVMTALPWLADKATVKKALEAARGNIDAAVTSLLEEQERSSSSAQGSSSAEQNAESDDDNIVIPMKRQDRKMSRATRSAQTRNALAALQDGSQESVGSWEDSETSSMPESSQQSSFTPASIASSDSKQDNSSPKPTIRLRLNGPKAPDNNTHLRTQRVGRTSQRQLGPRVTAAREQRDIKKLAQKAARKKREMQADLAKHNSSPTPNPIDDHGVVAATGIVLRQKGLTGTPPVDILKTLYI